MEVDLGLHQFGNGGSARSVVIALGEGRVILGSALRRGCLFCGFLVDLWRWGKVSFSFGTEEVKDLNVNLTLNGLSVGPFQRLSDFSHEKSNIESVSLFNEISPDGLDCLLDFSLNQFRSDDNSNTASVLKEYLFESLGLVVLIRTSIFCSIRSQHFLPINFYAVGNLIDDDSAHLKHA